MFICTPLSMTQNFSRRIKFRSGDVELTDEQIDFAGKIEYSEQWVDDLAIIRLFNLRSSTISVISGNQTIEIEAGYEGETGLIYEGTIRSVQTTEREDDAITTIISGTGIRQFDDLFFSKSYQTSVTPEQVAQDILSKVDLVQEGNLQIGGRAYPSHVVSRTGLQEIYGLQRDFDITAYLRELKLYMEPRDTLVGDRTSLIDSSTGLLTVKRGLSRVRDEEAIEIRSNLNPNLFSGAGIDLRGTDEDGTYRAVEGKHLLSEPYTSTAIGVEV